MELLHSWTPWLIKEFHRVQDIGVFKLLCGILVLVIVCQFFLLRKRKKRNRSFELFLKELHKYEIFKDPTVQESLRILAKKRLDNLVRLENRGILRELIKKSEGGNGNNNRGYSPVQKKVPTSPPSSEQAPRVQLTEVTRTVEGRKEDVQHLFTSAKQQGGGK